MSVSAAATPTDRDRFLTVPAALAGATLLFYLATTSGYGYFRDELYYLACAEHLDWGYVDHPPLIAAVTWLVRRTLGDSLFALRLLPGIAGAATVYLTGWMAAQFGGGRFAQAVASICALIAPIYLVLFSLLTMNAFDVLFWTAMIAIVIRILDGGNPRLWMLFGLVAGIGLENKISVLFLGFGLVVGLAVAREWRHLRSPWLWAGGLIAAAFFAPHVAWQVRHGWPTLEFIANAQRGKIELLSPFAFFGQEIVLLHPLAAPIWLAGAAFLLFARRARRYRSLGWMFVAVFVLMIVQRTKPYYLGAAFPVLLAAGALVVETTTHRPAVRRLRPVVLGLLLAGGALMAPLAKALLPIDEYRVYAAHSPFEARNGERSDTGPVWQIFADQFGWPELTARTAAVYRALPADEQAHACIGASNYGEAGAIDFFGPRYGLPKAMSVHNSYWLWGPHGCDGRVVIMIGRDDPRELAQMFDRVELAAVTSCVNCMPYESAVRIFVNRGLKLPIGEVWNARKTFD